MAKKAATAKKRKGRATKTTAASSKAASGKRGGDENKSKRDEKMQKELDVLGQEYDIAVHARSSLGHFKRKVPRDQSKIRTQKRKRLEKQDEEVAALTVAVHHLEDTTERLRGSQRAFEEDLIEDSMVIRRRQRNSALAKQMESEDSSSDSNVGEFSEDDAQHDTVVEEDGSIHDDNEDEDEDEDDNNDNDDDEEANEVIEEGGDLEVSDNENEGGRIDVGDNTTLEPDRERKDGRKRKKSKKRKVLPRNTGKRKLFRLRNFQSQRMAKRHGEAIAAHTEGQPKRAIMLLKEVAKLAPSAPQVYSSLGMVYEDMLHKSRGRSKVEEKNEEIEYDPITDKENSIPDPVLAEQFNLAKKAYGSFHVAAILCKKDFTLWVRAADAGAEVVEIIREVMLLPGMTMELIAYHRSEIERWQAEILRDLKAADQRRPPGIDVPCKLAAMHIELGQLSEALTILTDLKNRRKSTGWGRSEFQSSYKAWLLYADLMLRVGHECIQWSQGVKTNENYMFRRWLRKYSKTFDWQERRLQALCLGLEAAVGSKSSLDCINWLRNRVSRTKNERAAMAENFFDRVDDNGLETERQILMANNASEIELYDKTTEDMGLDSNSQAADNRRSERDLLLQAHVRAMSSLDTEFATSIKEESIESVEDEMMIQFDDPLPISASCRHVCRIAAELMKHLHGLELFEGVLHVGDTVSNYLKKRSEKYDRRVRASKRIAEWEEQMKQPSFLFQSYEERSSDEEDSINSDVQLPLSDDEDIDDRDNSSLLDFLRKGVLPPELRVLYGLALIRKGDRQFLAAKCLEAIDDLEPESDSWLSAGEREMEASGQSLWFIFRMAMTEPLGRTAAYAFLADVLRKSDKEREWSVHFAPWFRKHLDTLESSGLKGKLMSLKDETQTPLADFRKSQLMKIILRACSFDIDAIDRPEQTSSNSQKPGRIQFKERIDMAIDTLKSMSEVAFLIWSVDQEGRISSICIDVIKVVKRCMIWLANVVKDRLSYNQLSSILEHTQAFLSIICGSAHLTISFKSKDEIASLQKYEWNDLPVGVEWHSTDYKSLSLRVYNIIVACNVPLFSGWESGEFTLRQLRRRFGHKHFGIHIHDDRVTGLLHHTLERTIEQQWHNVRNLLPNFPDVKFKERLDTVKQSDWYIKEVEDRKNTPNANGDVTSYGEDSAECLFLAYSELCLHMAASEINGSIRNRLLHTSLSILFPVTQFCVDERMWKSEIGEAAYASSRLDEWRLINRVDEDRIHTYDKKMPRRRKSEKVIEKKVKEWIQGSEKPILKSFVTLPLTEMRNAWFENMPPVSDLDKDIALKCMKSVDDAVVKLRQCFSEAVTEKICLSISTELLKLAAQPGCFDPFRCLQQAAMYASQASKAGHSDVPYRETLPEKTKCTPLEALVILGRADCLHAVYFPNEAAFLCSYVALTCRFHRDQGMSNDSASHLKWNNQWRIVAIYAYNVSVMIRSTVFSVLDKEQQQSFLSMWERDVVEELERGRSDGWLWKRRLSNSEERDIPSSFAFGDNFEGDEADYSDGEEEDCDDEDQFERVDFDEDATQFTSTDNQALQSGEASLATDPGVEASVPPILEQQLSSQVKCNGDVLEVASNEYQALSSEEATWPAEDPFATSFTPFLEQQPPSQLNGSSTVGDKHVDEDYDGVDMVSV